MKRDTFLSPAFRRTARPIDEARALELLRAGWPAYKVRREVGGRTARILELARRNGIALKRGPKLRPFDETRALELLRDGMPARKVTAAVGAGSMRTIVRLARVNGIALRRRRTDAELRAQEGLIRDLRERGSSWEQVVRRLGYTLGGLSSVVRRSRRMAGVSTMHAKKLRAIFCRLLVANDGRASYSDVPSFLRMAANERRHWLLRPAEIELARRYRLLPAHCMDVPASELIDRSLHMPPLTPHPSLNLLASNY